VIRLIRSSKTPREAKELLVIRFALTEIKAQAILDLRLQRLTGLEILTLRKELEDLHKRIKHLESILASEKKLLGVVKALLLDVKGRYADARRTRIVAEAPAEYVPPAEKEAQPALIALTQDGFLKRMQPKAFSKKEDDGVARVFEIASDWKLLFFTDKGACYTLSPEQVPECRLKDRGAPFTALLAGLEQGERVVEALAVPPGEEGSEYFFFTKNGMVKRTPCAEYGARRGKVSALTLKEDDVLIAVRIYEAGKDILLVSRMGFAIRFSPDEVAATGRVSSGVKGMALEENDGLVFAGFAGSGDEAVLFSDRGYAKRSLMVDYDRQKRAGKGLKTFVFNKNGSNGNAVACAAVLSGVDCTLVVRQKSGNQTKVQASEIMVEPRFSKGSPCIMVLMDDVVTGLAVVK